MRFCFALRAAERTPAAKLAQPRRASTETGRARGPFPFLRAGFGPLFPDLIFSGAIWGCQPARSVLAGCAYGRCLGTGVLVLVNGGVGAPVVELGVVSLRAWSAAAVVKHGEQPQRTVGDLQSCSGERTEQRNEKNSRQHLIAVPRG